VTPDDAWRVAAAWVTPCCACSWALNESTGKHFCLGCGKQEELSMDFGEAVRALKAGSKVAREGWNGKGMFLFLVPGSTFTVNRPPLLGIYPEGTSVNYHAHIDMKTAQDTVVPWLASQTDVLAEDWQLAG